MIVIGLDVGQARDHAARVIIRATEQARAVGHRFVWDVLDVAHVPLDTSYAAIVGHTVALADDFASEGYPCLVALDASGVGRALLEQARTRQRACPPGRCAPVVGITSTASATPGGQWPDLTAPKRAMLDAVAVALKQRGLRLHTSRSPDDATLARELRAMTHKPNGRREAAGSGHDDLAMALTYAVWLGDQLTDQQHRYRAHAG